MSDAIDTRLEAWQAELEQLLVRGNRFIWEVAFFHKAWKTIVLTDLVESIGDETEGTNWVPRLWWKAVMHRWNTPKPAPEYQLGWKDKAAAERSPERILALDFERMIIAHGENLKQDAKEALRRAWASEAQLHGGWNLAAVSYGGQRIDVPPEMNLHVAFDRFKKRWTVKADYGGKLTEASGSYRLEGNRLIVSFQGQDAPPMTVAFVQSELHVAMVLDPDRPEGRYTFIAKRGAFKPSPKRPAPPPAPTPAPAPTRSQP